MPNPRALARDAQAPGHGDRTAPKGPLHALRRASAADPAGAGGSIAVDFSLARG
ncbi:MAG TPA: hypothetical protein VE093_02265 [Polyangiaceae bacterium]|nr:hypothetical protein [Polyangiaceae bacterium]